MTTKPESAVLRTLLLSGFEGSTRLVQEIGREGFAW